MLTSIEIRNFKLFDDIRLELGDRVVLVGPNNAGKSTALQAFALWDVGLKRWLEKRGTGDVPTKRSGVTINRRDLIAVPVPVANLLWRDLHVRSGRREQGQTRTENVLIQVVVQGIEWTCGLEFDYANPESFYCRPLKLPDGRRMAVPEAAGAVRIAYLPPMSGLAANETRLDRGAINVRLGEGRTAEVLRNLCHHVLEGEDGEAQWDRIVCRMESLFGSHLDEPRYVAERGEIDMSYHTRDRVQLDISASGRGQQQTLLLLAHMAANPGSVLLLDEPDAHLEILRQRQTYQVLSETAEETGSQIIAASHSEVVLNEAADRDVLIAFVGKPHRIDDRGSQVAKALKEIGFEHYLQAEEKGWVLYLEGSTDLAILLALARRLNHPAAELLESPYVHYVANQPRKAQEHFYGVREARANLVGVAIYDQLTQDLPSDPHLTHLMWRRRELENYLCQRETLLDFADAEGQRLIGELFGQSWRDAMGESIAEIEQALQTLGDPSPWGAEIKASDAFLDRVFKRFFDKVGIGNLMRKTDYHRLTAFVPPNQIDPEIIEKLDAIVETASNARPKGE
jgi:ABC-type arginine transport system ATPase subunit